MSGLFSANAVKYICHLINQGQNCHLLVEPITRKDVIVAVNEPSLPAEGEVVGVC